VPAALVANHGLFTWAATRPEAVERAAVLESREWSARDASSLQMPAPADDLINKHFSRKHGNDAITDRTRLRRSVTPRGFCVASGLDECGG
jgi:L-ribulose-5-phosphate 4-epimerase